MNIKQEKIDLKEKEIEKYKIILSQYRGRWYNMGQTHLESLEKELEQLKKDSLK